MDLHSIYWQGYNDYKYGQFSSPYEFGSEEWEAWNEGFEDAYREEEEC